MAIFTPLVLLTYLFILLESYFHVGAFLVDSRIAIFACFIVSAFVVRSSVYRFNKYVFIFSLIFYIFMQIFEVINYHNYVFSKVHIQPSVFFNLVIFSGVLLLNSKVKIFRKNYLWIIVVGLMFSVITKTIDQAIYSNLYIISHLTNSYDEKMRERWTIYYDYMQFIKNNTPENASILIPPQERPWSEVGNAGLNKYFLYPRHLENGYLSEVVNPENYDYVMIAWGTDLNEPLEKYGWPKVSVKSEKVIYYTNDAGVFSVQGDYDPKSSLENGAWGIIKVKK